MNPDAMTEEGQALLRLLGGEGAALDSTRLAAFGSWLVATLKAEVVKGDSGCKQEWGTPEQVAAIYGVQRAQANVWLNKLVERGKVRRWQAETANGGQGFMRYNLDDIAKAWAVEQGTGHEKA